MPTFSFEVADDDLARVREWIRAQTDVSFGDGYEPSVSMLCLQEDEERVFSRPANRVYGATWGGRAGSVYAWYHESKYGQGPVVSLMLYQDGGARATLVYYRSRASELNDVELPGRPRNSPGSVMRVIERIDEPSNADMERLIGRLPEAVRMWREDTHSTRTKTLTQRRGPVDWASAPSSGAAQIRNTMQQDKAGL